MDGRTASLHAYDRQESVWRRKDGKKGTSTNTAQAASTSTHTTLDLVVPVVSCYLVSTLPQYYGQGITD
jgi:hypothetical protein